MHFVFVDSVLRGFSNNHLYSWTTTKMKIIPARVTHAVANLYCTTNNGSPSLELFELFLANGDIFGSFCDLVWKKSSFYLLNRWH